MGRAIRLGLERCRVCAGATERDDRLCTGCADAVERGDRDALRERGLAYLLGRFPIIARDRSLAPTLERSQRRYFPADWGIGRDSASS